MHRRRPLNTHNNAYPLAHPSEAAAIATLRHEGEIQARLVELRRWTDALAADLRSLGVRTFRSETYFFLADFTPHDAGQIAARLKENNILIRALGDNRLGGGYMRVTTALPEDNARFLSAWRTCFDDVDTI